MAEPKTVPTQTLSMKKSIRTFAGDLEAERKKQGIEDEGLLTNPAEKKKKGPAPIAASPKATKKIERKPFLKPKTKPIPQAPKVGVDPEEIAETTKLEKVERAATPKAVPKIDKKIPAFHELQKASEKIINASNSEEGKRTNIGFDATVITDTKQKRFKLLPSIIDSVGQWFKEEAGKKKKEENSYSIPDSSRRKGVVQKATSKTGSIFTDDSETIREKIRQRKKQEQKQSSLSTDSNEQATVSKHESDLVWTPNTETVYKLLEGGEEEPRVKNINVEFRKPFGIPTEPAQDLKQTATSAENEEEWVPPIREDKADVQKTQDDIDDLRWSQVPDNNETTTNPDLTNERSGVAKEEPLEDKGGQELEQQTESVNKQIQESETKKEKEDVSTTLKRSGFDTNTVTVLVLLFIALAVAGVVGTKTFLLPYLQQTNETPPQIVTPDTLVNEATSGVVVITVSNANNLPGLLKKTFASSSALTEVSVVIETGEEISPSYTFQLLNFEAQPTLRKSLTSVRFIGSNTMKPVFLLRFNDEDTVRGGLLNWEQNMLDDFGVLYQYSRVATSATFQDEIVTGLDTRIVRENGKALLVYSIVDNNTAIVAGSIADFTQVAEILTNE